MHRLTLAVAALLFIPLALASDTPDSEVFVPFSIELDLDPPSWPFLWGQEVFTAPGAPAELRTLTEKVYYIAGPGPERRVEPLEENLPAVWLPLDLDRPERDATEAALLISSPRLMQVPISGHDYAVLLEYQGKGEMLEPVRIDARPPRPGSNYFPTLIISFERFLAAGNELPPLLVISGDISISPRSP